MYSRRLKQTFATDYFRFDVVLTVCYYLLPTYITYLPLPTTIDRDFAWFVAFPGKSQKHKTVRVFGEHRAQEFRVEAT